VQLLMGTFSALSAESVEDQERLCRACIRALGAHRAGRTPAFLIQQLSSIMCPAEVEPVYYLTLQKSPTQEEFIRGGMTKNPYPSSELGASMRDVKRKICIDLDMAGLIEDDNGMELLVRGRVPSAAPPPPEGSPSFRDWPCLMSLCFPVALRADQEPGQGRSGYAQPPVARRHIVALDLPIRLVYEQVWRAPGAAAAANGSAAAPMVVVYRLQVRLLPARAAAAAIALRSLRRSSMHHAVSATVVSACALTNGHALSQ